MARLFTALWPSDDAVRALDTALGADPGWPPSGWRGIPTERWHLTLCFHGEADPDRLTERLARRAADRGAPWLRLAGTVRFTGVLAVGVETGSPGDTEALAGLVAAAGGRRSGFRAHVTVARSRRGGGEAAGHGRSAPAGLGPLPGHRGPWWQPAEVCLVGSEQAGSARRYLVLHREPLHRQPPGEELRQLRGTGASDGPAAAPW